MAQSPRLEAVSAAPPTLFPSRTDALCLVSVGVTVGDVVRRGEEMEDVMEPVPPAHRGDVDGGQGQRPLGLVWVGKGGLPLIRTPDGVPDGWYVTVGSDGVVVLATKQHAQP